MGPRARARRLGKRVTVDANHARPMLAYGLLALVAAMITALGLHDGGSSVTVRAGSPSPVSRTGTPQLLLGDVLHAAPGLEEAVPLAASLPSVLIGDVAGVTGRAASPRAPVVAPKPQASSSVKARQPRARPKQRATTTAPTTTARPTTPTSVTKPTTTSKPSKTTRTHPAPARGHSTSTSTVRTQFATAVSPTGHGRGRTHAARPGTSPRH